VSILSPVTIMMSLSDRPAAAAPCYVTVTVTVGSRPVMVTVGQAGTRARAGP
jgi:hypothetical protein